VFLVTLKKNQHCYQKLVFLKLFTKLSINNISRKMASLQNKSGTQSIRKASEESGLRLPPIEQRG
jgi:hypothetical protein